MRIATPEIQEMEKRIDPYRVGLTDLKQDTPPEIVELNKKVQEYYKVEFECEQ